MDKDPMQRVTDNVKARYQRKGLANSSNTWPPFHAQSFTNLALVHQRTTQLQAKEDTTKIAKVRATGDIQKVSEQTSLIELNNILQIFTPISSRNQTQYPMSILIEGHPGTGKTTLAKEMCLQWANNKLLISQKLLLLLMLRDPNIQAITNTKELVRYTLSTDHDQVQCVLSYLQDNNGAGVTLIIDGFDELGSELRQTSFFRKVIEGDVLCLANVVVTSRPSTSACLHQYVGRRIEILGFDKSSREQYMKDNLKEKPELYNKLSLYFKEYPNIDALCYIPLNMAIIVYLCQLGSLPPTSTKMYRSFIMHIICHHLKRAGMVPEDKVITRLEQFPAVVCTALEQLEKISFDGLMNDKIIFTVEELPVICKDNPTCFGILQSTECYGAEEVGASTRSFNFLHLGIQEYLAAKYVTSLPEDKVYTLLKESFIVTDRKHSNRDSKNVRLSNMWILYCGITRGQCKTLRLYLTVYGKPQDSTVTSSTDGYFATTNSEQVSIDSQEKVSRSSQQGSNSDQRISNTGTISQDILKDLEKVLYLFQCFQEAEDNVLCEILSKSFDNGLINIRGHGLLPHQLVSLGFFLSRSCRKWKELNLESCCIRDYGLSILQQYLCGDKGNKQEITKITLNGNSLTKASSYLIADIIHHLHPHTLNLCSNKITNVRDISASVITTSTVKVLDMSFNELTAQEADAISDMTICLEELDISDNELGDHGAELLSKGIINTKTLRVLNISKNNIGPSGTMAIANAISNNTSLKELRISNNKLGDHEAELLSKRLENNKLKVLDISNNNIGPSGTKIIANALFKNTSLQELYMKNIGVGQVGAIAIANAFAKNKTLRKLSLWDNAMDKESARIIMKGLRCNNTITELFLSLSLCNDTDVKSEIASINDTRRKCNIQDLVVDI